MRTFAEFLSELQPRLAADKFRVSQNVALPNGRVADLVASRLHWGAGGFLLSQHFFVVEMDDPNDKDMDDLYEAGLRYAKQNNRVPLLRGMFFGHEIIPCIITRNASGRLRSYVTGPPPVRLAQPQFPIVFDLASGETHYFRGTTTWGMILWPELQLLAAQHIEKAPLSQEAIFRLGRLRWPFYLKIFGSLLFNVCFLLPYFLTGNGWFVIIYGIISSLSIIPTWLEIRHKLKADREAMQARHDAEDTALFGKPLRELMDAPPK